MRNKLIFIILATAFITGIRAKTATAQTYCNPLDLSSEYQPVPNSKPDIADPTIVLYKDNYFLFASNAGGYWHSNDLLSWKFVSGANLPFENSAPTAVVIDGWVYFFTSLCGKIYRSNDPASGRWEEYGNSLLFSVLTDFTVFADTDGRVYCYYGCSNNDGIMVRELDAKNRFNPIGVPTVCRRINPLKSVRKKGNSAKTGSYGIRGSWMNKYNGKYYFQCTKPINNLMTYSDFVYVSDSPTGPFVFAENNPFSSRPDGFVCGAGNGSTFTDKYGNWWHVATMTAPANRLSPSRLGLFPAGFDKEGNLFAKTDFGDYPMIVPNQKITNLNKLDPQWALLADNLTAQASSSLAITPVAFAFDENIGTFWSAQTGKKGEWLSVDLGSVCTINAYQLNFAENKVKPQGQDSLNAFQYVIEYSIDKKIWKKLADKTANTEYRPNPFEALKTPVQAQYLKITNYHVPDGTTFAISGLRFFGSGTDRLPKKINEFRAVKDYRDPQLIKMSWKKPANAKGYNIRYGTDKDKLYHSYQVYKNSRITIHCPDKDKSYWFEIDAFNENGVTPGKVLPAK